MLAKDIMTVGVITAKPETTIKDAIKLLVEIQISGLMVLDDNNDIVGVVTEKDLLVAYDFLGTTQSVIKDFICTDIISVTPDTPMQEISKILVQKNIKRVPVIEEGKLLGVVSRRDVLRSILGLEENQ